MTVLWVLDGDKFDEPKLLPTGKGTHGLYVGREIAPFGGRSRPLDWTGVFTVFTKRR